MTEKFLKLIGFDNRIRLEWVSASEGSRYGQVVTEFTQQIKDLGPSPAKNDPKLITKLKALEKAAGTDRMRALVGRQRHITEDENVYGEKLPLEKFNEIFDKAIKDEFERAQVLYAVEKGINNVKLIAKELEIDPSMVLEHLLILKSRMEIDFGEIIENTPVYVRL